MNRTDPVTDAVEKLQGVADRAVMLARGVIWERVARETLVAMVGRSTNLKIPAVRRAAYNMADDFLAEYDRRFGQKEIP